MTYSLKDLLNMQWLKDERTVYALNSQRENVFSGYLTGYRGQLSDQTERELAEIVATVPRLVFLLRQINSSLPINRDWLDPAVEREMKHILGEIEERGD